YKNLTELQNGFAYACKFLKESFQLVQFEHIGTVRKRTAGVRMGFDEKTVGTYGDSGFCYCFYKFRAATGNSGTLVGLLKGMRYIQDYRCILLHSRDAAEVHHQV